MTKPISLRYAEALHAIASAGHDIAAAIREAKPARAGGGVVKPSAPRYEPDAVECVVPGATIRVPEPGRLTFSQEFRESLDEEIARLGERLSDRIRSAMGLAPNLTTMPRPLPTQEELADVLAQHYGDHENLAAVPDQHMRQNYLSDARSILNLLGGGTR